MTTESVHDGLSFFVKTGAVAAAHLISGFWYQHAILS
jgi:hypothetical protein